jgi:hypothetical protein
MHQSVDPLDVRVVERTLGLGLTGETASDELSVENAGWRCVDHGLSAVSENLRTDD